jgi:hypothetical protein
MVHVEGAPQDPDLGHLTKVPNLVFFTADFFQSPAN